MKQNKQFVLGITGGVGCGKSTVLSVLREEYGILVLEADRVGRELQQPGTFLWPELVSRFPDCISEDGTLDRAKTARVILRDPKRRAVLERMMHPAIHREILSRIDAADSSVIAVEAALLLEAGYDEFCSEVWYIHTDDEIRRLRLKLSRGYTDEKIDSMFAAQLSEEEFTRRCDLTIDNSRSPEETKTLVRREMDRILSELETKPGEDGR